MAQGKSPGLDGFTIDFFQVGWPIIGNDIWEVVEESRSSRSILQVFNATFITLIPKIKGELTLQISFVPSPYAMSFIKLFPN
jgi:hypothetical protein